MNSPSLILTVHPMHFGAVLGIGGLGNGWRVAARLYNVPALGGEFLAVVAFTIWLVLTLLYVAKWGLYPYQAREDLQHPVRGLLTALVPVSTLIASISIAPILPLAGWWLFVLGTLGVLGYAAWSIGELWQGGRDVEATTPILYMPTVGGGLVAAIACGTFNQPTLGWMVFGFGLLSWVAMESVILARLFVHKLPPGLRSTLGMQLAPAAVACVAYLSLTQSEGADRFALILFGYGCFLALVMVRLVPWLREQRFGPGAWGYTFGVSALPLAALLLVERGASDLEPLALVLFIAANLIIGWIAARTLVLLGRALSRAGRIAILL